MTTVSSATQATSTTSTASSRLNETMDSFLLMLTTQMQNQDPLNPMDSTEFTNQLVMFSGVEQQINTNTKLDSILSAQKTGQVQNALNYIGLSAEVVGDTVPFSGSDVDFVYSLPNEAKKVSISILDKAGNVVWSGTGDTQAGKHVLSWNGTTSSGTTAETGIYKITVGAVDALDETMDTTTYVSRLITGVENNDNGTFLLSGNDVIDINDIGAVTYPAYQTSSTEE